MQIVLLHKDTHTNEGIKEEITRLFQYSEGNEIFINTRPTGV